MHFLLKDKKLSLKLTTFLLNNLQELLKALNSNNVVVV